MPVPTPRRDFYDLAERHLPVHADSKTERRHIANPSRKQLCETAVSPSNATIGNPAQKIDGPDGDPPDEIR